MSDRQLSQERLAMLKAADYIEEHGWCRGKMSDSAGRVCVYGALASVTQHAGLVLLAGLVMQRYLKMDMVQWNDTRSRHTGQAEVITALRDAAMAGLGE